MNKLINEILTDIRKEHKLTRKGLEGLSGFKARNIENYERGVSKPPSEYIEFMSLYFGYTIDYINGKSKSVLGIFFQVVKMYQSVYNYDDKKMAELLNLNIESYKNEFNINSNSIKNNIFKKHCLGKCFEVLEILNIKPSSAKIYKTQIEQSSIYDENKIENLEERYSNLELKGVEMTPDFYASIIKKRNSPKDNYTPKDELKEIPSKHKEILDLLSYAPDSFIDTIIEKLRTIKDSQVL